MSSFFFFLHSFASYFREWVQLRQISPCQTPTSRKRPPSCPQWHSHDLVHKCTVVDLGFEQIHDAVHIAPGMSFEYSNALPAVELSASKCCGPLLT